MGFFFSFFLGFFFDFQASVGGGDVSLGRFAEIPHGIVHFSAFSRVHPRSYCAVIQEI